MINCIFTFVAILLRDGTTELKLANISCDQPAVTESLLKSAGAAGIEFWDGAELAKKDILSYEILKTKVALPEKPALQYSNQSTALAVVPSPRPLLSCPKPPVLPLAPWRRVVDLKRAAPVGLLAIEGPRNSTVVALPKPKKATVVPVGRLESLIADLKRSVPARALGVDVVGNGTGAIKKLANLKLDVSDAALQVPGIKKVAKRLMVSRQSKPLLALPQPKVFHDDLLAKIPLSHIALLAFAEFSLMALVTCSVVLYSLSDEEEEQLYTELLNFVLPGGEIDLDEELASLVLPLPAPVESADDAWALLRSFEVFDEINMENVDDVWSEYLSPSEDWAVAEPVFSWSEVLVEDGLVLIDTNDETTDDLWTMFLAQRTASESLDDVWKLFCSFEIEDEDDDDDVWIEYLVSDAEKKASEEDVWALFRSFEPFEAVETSEVDDVWADFITTAEPPVKEAEEDSMDDVLALFGYITSEIMWSDVKESEC